MYTKILLFTQALILFIFTINQDIVLKNEYLSNIEEIEKLLSTNNKKMVILGGSSVGWSLDSSQIEEAFQDYDVVSYGLHAGLGYEFLLNHVSEFLNEEDVLVIGFEYEQYTQLLKGTDTQIKVEYYIEFDYTNLVTKQLYVYNNFFDHYWNQNVDLIDTQSLFESPYRSDVVDSNGNITGHYNLNPRSLSEPKILFTDNYTEEIDNIYKLLEELRSLGIEYFITFPPITQSYYRTNLNSIIDIKDYLKLKFESRIISEHYNYVFDDSDFFDTHYHMNINGIPKRTSILIEDLSKTIE